MIRRLVALAIVLLAACGPRDVPPVDYGPPPPAEPIDPIACPAEALERFAAGLGVPGAITTEPIVEAARVDKLPCQPEETDAACLARARRRPVPASYELAGVTVGGEVTHVDFTYELDGRIVSDRADSPAAMAAKLRALQAARRRVVLLSYAAAEDAIARHAAIAYRGIGGRQRRIVTLRWPPADAHARTMAEVQAAAERERIQVRRMDTTPEGELVIVATCGPS